MARNLWRSWKRLAHRAAEIQAIVILTIVYWLVVAPIGLMLKMSAKKGTEAGWKVRPASGPVPLEDARRQS